jgi:cytochrome c biogenesis protein CcmG/thiol:disulfide interchange protein DsbE
VNCPGWLTFAISNTLHMNGLCLLMATVLYFAAAPTQELPDVNLRQLDGELVNIRDYATNDKVTILSFWATWCTPCKRELDAIQDLYPEWQETYNVEVLAINVDDARAQAKVRPLLEEAGWEFEVLMDPSKQLMQALGFETIPQTFIVGLDGQVVYEHNGYKPGDEYALEDFLKEL